MAKVYKFYLYLLVSNILYEVIQATCRDSKKNMNGGTVLFSESDNTKQCWSSENIALLTSRMILEDVLPSPHSLKMNSEDFVADIIDYFRLILEVVREVTFGKTKHIMLLALTDLLGGYLNNLVLPIAKYSYYAGNINYESSEKLHQLFDELKCFLRTGGQGWKKPVKVSAKHAHIELITLEAPGADKSACEGLITYEKSPMEEASPNQHKKCELEIPMPFFDSRQNPSSVAVPFRKYSLRNIQSKSAAYILLKYYVAASKCLMMENSNPDSLHNYNNQLYSWLNKYVMPRLSDDKFYAAFGGVLRIYETLKKNGVGQSGSKTIGSFNIMPEVEEHEPPKDDENAEGMEDNKESKKHKFGIVLIALLSAIFILFLLGALFICFRIRQSRKQKDAECGYRSPSCRGSTKGSQPSSPKSGSRKSGFRFDSGAKAVRKKLFSRDTDGGSDSPRTSKSGKSSAKPKAMFGKGPRVCTPNVCPNLQKQKEQRPSQRSFSSAVTSEDDNSETEGSSSSRREPEMIAQIDSGTSESAPKMSSSSTSKSKGRDRSLSVRTQDSFGGFDQDKSKKSSTDNKGVFCEPCGSEGACRTICVEQADRAVEADFPEDGNAPEGPYYPPTYACHTSMGGRFRPGSSTDDAGSRSTGANKVPFVFGYDFQTTSSESSPRGIGTSEGDTDFKGNMSK